MVLINRGGGFLIFIFISLVQGDVGNTGQDGDTGDNGEVGDVGDIGDPVSKCHPHSWYMNMCCYSLCVLCSYIDQGPDGLDGTPGMDGRNGTDGGAGFPGDDVSMLIWIGL